MGTSTRAQWDNMGDNNIAIRPTTTAQSGEIIWQWGHNNSAIRKNNMAMGRQQQRNQEK
jgi:hypothetical protein